MTLDTFAAIFALVIGLTGWSFVAIGTTETGQRGYNWVNGGMALIITSAIVCGVMAFVDYSLSKLFQG